MRIFHFALATAFIATSAAPAAIITFYPVRASGTEGVDWYLGPGEREITLTRADQFVEVLLFIRDFAPRNIIHYQVALDCDEQVLDEYDALSAACPVDGDFGTDFCMGVDTTRPDHLFAEADGVRATCGGETTHCTNGTGGPRVCLSDVLFGDPAMDLGVESYLMQYGFYIGSSAGGSYTVTADLNPDLTVIWDDHYDYLQIAGFEDATITVLTGTCCAGKSCIDGVNGTACGAINGELVPDASCLGDTDGDGIDDTCDVCAGGNDLLDSDGDSVPDDCDNCPGVDDLAFPDCFAPIPTMQAWGVIVLALLLLVASKVTWSRRLS